MYQLTTEPDRILCLTTNTNIPRGHRLWDDYQQWLDDGNTPLPLNPPPDIESEKNRIKAAATEQRWLHETGGINVGGSTVATGLDDQNRITSVLAAAALGNMDEVDFKSASGWVRLTIAQVQGIGMAVSAHIQGCFSAERAHHEAIDALTTVEAVGAYDVTSGWPEGVV